MIQLDPALRHRPWDTDRCHDCFMDNKRAVARINESFVSHSVSPISKNLKKQFLLRPQTSLKYSPQCPGVYGKIFLKSYIIWKSYPADFLVLMQFVKFPAFNNL